ncbi:MAG: hypothetical protein NT010_07415 [Proteobacteria bacterium]|nr:hypothetical protein [Pseudomonadota bacterium]
MKKLLLFGCIAILSIIMAAPGQAVAGIIFGATEGSGTAGSGGVSYSYDGIFGFDNTTPYPTPYGLQTLKTIVGDVGQFSLNINSSGVTAYDFNGYTLAIPAVPVGTYTWVLNNQNGAGGTILYGNVVNWNFAPDQGTQSYGTVNGTLQSNGFIHWYYGYDSYVGPPAGQTSLASMGLSDTFTFTGNYSITYGEDSSPIGYNLTGTLSANQVPVPPSLFLLAPGLLGLVGIKRKYLG